MSSQISHAVEGVPERFVPAEMHGELVEAEHMARYQWASAFCAGRRVLDAGCGVGYGAHLLKRAGASEVLAVDISEAIIEVAGNDAPDGVVCEVADLRALGYLDDSFDLVVCFEVIEHVDEQDRVLDQLARVLRPGGLLLISSPNRGRYVPGNPHHRREYVPSELRVALESRFGAVRLLAQHAMLASAIASPHDQQFDGAHVERLVEPGEEDEIYTLAIAGEELPPESPPMVALTQFLEIRQWLKRYDGQDRVLKEQARALGELDAMRRERLEALDLLASREQTLAELPVLRERLAQATSALPSLEEQVGALRARVDELARAERVARDMRASLSWRITAPLRGFKRLGRSLRGSARS
ncbi:MAG TPA: methyltransferase domain-containing protein [Solirubrobacteraceae bacterium]|jgi:SAM-dependent methyltransferase|nr:methyltransferase domain-containing protein [Solirubrobacteraceae bacterium]